MAAEPSQRICHRGRNVANLWQLFAEPDQVVAPRSAAKAVQQPLDGQLRSLLGCEAGPVVQLGAGLQPRAAQRGVGFCLPAPELVCVNEPLVHPSDRSPDEVPDLPSAMQPRASLFPRLPRLAQR